MAETIYIGNNIVDAETKVLFDRQDFVDLIWDKLGRDTGMYLDSLIEELYDEGYNKGLVAGQDTTAIEREEIEHYCYNDGRDDGYEEGWANGYAEGYAQGFEEGYKKHNCWP